MIRTNYASLYFKAINYRFYSTDSRVSERDLLVKSIVPSNYFQKHLFNLPIPKINHTLAEYELSQQAILDETQMAKTKKLIDIFAVKDGPFLHQYLKKFAHENKDTNYVNVLWTDRYLRDRSPVVLTHNPTMIMKNPNKATGNSDQATRAANLVWSSVRYLRSLQANLLEPIVFHRYPKKTDNEAFRKMVLRMPPWLAYYYAVLLKSVYPLDMSQQKYLFGSTRIPVPDKDKIVQKDNSRHILVIHKGKMYTFDILTPEGGAVDPTQIMANIQFVLSQPPTPGHLEPGLGIFTTMNRDMWASARHRLCHLGNEGPLGRIDSALFVLALDSDSYSSETELIENTLHGAAENRWFDKSFSLIVDGAGEAAINMEHSWGDGMIMVQYMDAVYKDGLKQSHFSMPLSDSEKSQLPVPRVDRLDLRLDASLTEEVLPQARDAYNSWRSSLNIDLVKFSKMGTLDIAAAKINKDSVMQLSFQMAHYLVHGGKQAATYESASTCAFKDGRTETLRPATLETKAFCEQWQAGADLQTLYEALTKCAVRHNQLVVKCSTGKGWDRHLYGLRTMAERHMDKIPDLFSDPSYSYINNIIISTSTVPSDALEGGGFAAVTKDGYGIGYGSRDRESGCIVTSWKGSDYSKGRQLCDALHQSFQKISDIIEYVKKKNEKIA